MPTIRPFAEADYPAIVSVYNRCRPDSPWSEEAARRNDGTWDYSRYVRLRHVAELDGRVVGYGQIFQSAFGFHPRKFTMHVMVDPESRQRGAGSGLYEKLLEELAARDAMLVRADVREDDSVTIAFVTRRGFVEARRSWESQLSLEGFDLARFAAAEERVRDAGIAISTAASERERRPDWERLVYELHGACGLDEPQLDEPTMPSFEYWRERNVGSEDFIPEGCILAVDPSQPDRYAGMSVLYRIPGYPEELHQSFTGVHRDYRGKGIGLAMKLAGIRFALASGIKRIHTENDSLNAPMLRINDALGFQREPANVTFQKDLG